MIDWITCKIPMHHLEEIHDGSVISARADGSLHWTVKRRKKVTGSFESGLQIRTLPCTAHERSHIELSGNPVKFFQGHNLWGTDDLPALLISTLSKLVAIPELTLEPTLDDINSWLLDGITLSRVDITCSFSLGNRSRCLEWLRAAEHSAHLPFRGRGQLVKGSTLYFGKNSRRWSLKLYSKGEEITVKGHAQESILELPHAIAWADGILRAELTVRGLELDRLNLRTVKQWLPHDGTPFDISAMLTKHLGDMTMTTTRTLSDDVMASLTTAQKNGYLAWLAGNDLRTTMSKTAFYSFRSKLLPHGIDVSVCTPSEISNVVPMIRILEAVPVGVPDWAIGTALYFEPKLARVA
jgi:II/X family phage/plasmid replication protein